MGSTLLIALTKENNQPPRLARDWSISVRPRTEPWRRCGWCPRMAPLIIGIKRCSGTRGLQLCRCKAPLNPAKLHDPTILRSCLLNRRNRCLHPKRNRKSTWGEPSELSGVRQAARCPYDAAEPSWARSRCNSSSRQPIQ